MSHTPRKRFGQNFLIDAGVIANIIAAINPQANDTIVEIGPGMGALTRSLLASNARVHAIEIDRDLAKFLEGEYGKQRHFNLHCIDVLKFQLSSITTDQNAASMRVVGNLPYNISTPLLFKLFSELSAIKDMYFMLQREVAQRLIARPNNKDYGRMTVMAQYYCAMEIMLDVAPQAFDPQPKVHSCVVKFVPHKDKPAQVLNQDLFNKVVTQAFNQRRKTIANSLKTFLSASELQSLRIDPTLRAENLSLLDYTKITNFIAAR